MKLRFGKRLLTGIAGLLILLLGVYLLIVATGLFTPKVDFVTFASSLQLLERILLIVGAVLLCALGIVELGVLFHRRRDKGFVMQHTELGDMSISMNALDTMVCKCVEQHKELCVKSTTIDRAKDGIDIEIRILLETGVNIPLTVNALQKQIKQYITSCSGVDVNTVKVLVETDAGKAETPKLTAAHASEPIRFAEAPVHAAKHGKQNEDTDPAVPIPPADDAEALAAQAQPDDTDNAHPQESATEPAQEMPEEMPAADEAVPHDESESEEAIPSEDSMDFNGSEPEPSDADQNEPEPDNGAEPMEARQPEEWKHEEE